MTAHTGEAPAQAPRNKHEFTKGQKVTAYVGGVAALLTVGGYVGYKAVESGTEKGVKDALQTTTSLSVPIGAVAPALVDTYDANHDGQLDKEERKAMPADVYAQLPEQTRIDDQAGDIRQYLHTVLETFQAALTPEESETLSMPDFAKPLTEWSDQDYLNYGTLAEMLATNQIKPHGGPLTDNEKELIKEGIQALSAIDNPKTHSYDAISRWAANNPGVADKQVLKALPSVMTGVNITNIKIPSTSGDIYIGPEGGRVIEYATVSDTRGVVHVEVFANRSDGKGNAVPVFEGGFDNLQAPELQTVINTFGHH